MSGTEYKKSYKANEITFRKHTSHKYFTIAKELNIWLCIVS